MLINYLDSTITNWKNKLNFEIYRKPTTTDHIIHQDSCHPFEHKKAGICYLENRMRTYPLSQESKLNKMKIIETVLQNSNYSPTIIDEIAQEHNNKERHHDQ
jgi:hypothetical protein